MPDRPAAELKGVIAAALTPFDDRGRPDLAAYQRHIRVLEADRCDGVLLLGTTGEGPCLSLAERREALVAGRAAAGRMAVLACTTCASLPETVSLTRYAFDCGVDAVTLMPPFFFKEIEDGGLYAFFRQVLDEAVPAQGAVLLYHIPQVTQVPISFDLLERVLAASDGRLVGIKDSAGDLAHCEELCRRFPGLKVFTGNDQLILSALRGGAAGCVTGLVNLFAPMAAAICAAFDRSDPEADGLQNRFTGLWRVLERYQPYPSLLKALAARRYGDPGWRRVRPPLVELSSGRLSLLLEELSRLDLPEPYRWIQPRE